MASNTQTKLEALTKRKEKIANQIRQIQSKDGANKRKLDTRRKILLGAIFEKLITNKIIEINDVDKWLQTYLTKERDKELFDGYLESLEFTKEELN
jgi:large subunit ribosomal protein L7/L12